MISYTLLIFVLHFGTVQMPGFGTLKGCHDAEVSISRELHHQIQGSGAADFIVLTCVKVTK